MSSFNKRNRRIPKQLLSEKEEVVPEFLTLEEKISYFRNGLFNTDEIGSNWDVSSLRNAQGCEAVVLKIVSEFKQRYNLKNHRIPAS